MSGPSFKGDPTLGIFADRLRDCLGLDPLYHSRGGTRDMRSRSRAPEAERFYRPIPTAGAGMTPKRGSGA